MGSDTSYYTCSEVGHMCDNRISHVTTHYSGWSGFGWTTFRADQIINDTDSAMASVSRPSSGPTIDTPHQPRSFLSQNGRSDATRALPHH